MNLEILLINGRQDTTDILLSRERGQKDQFLTYFMTIRYYFSSTSLPLNLHLLNSYYMNPLHDCTQY